ncbi:hypothetical protein M1563_00610 [Patescibacteria group bacterium]|nr:hypothetical protein [Patescibacteria group bacterium]MCL5410119.1 hypothetical protein [Patescibacteria group bacterium]
MSLLKKILFAPLFLFALAEFINQLKQYLLNPYIIFNLDQATLLGILLLLGLLILASLLFGVFLTLANDWKIVAPVILCAAILPIALLNQPINTINPVSFILAGGLVFILGFVFVVLHANLASYLTFQPNIIISPAIKQTIALILILVSFTYYLSANMLIAKGGFTIPDSVFNFALQFIPSSELPSTQSLSSQLQVTPEQLQLLQQNPQLLQAYGLDPSILNNLQTSSPQTTANSLIKQTLQQEFQKMLAPYQQYIPILLAILFYFTLQFITMFLNLLIPVFIWLVFLILEKTAFVKFTVEMREVKKLVV